MTGSLFSAYFLDEGVTDLAGWLRDADRVADARAHLSALLEDFGARAAPSEANTERDLIDPVLELLGWSYLVQEKASRSDKPDYLLFAAANEKAAAARLPAAADRYAMGQAIVEAKAWELPLDRTEPGHAGAPSTQMLRYLGTVGVQSNDAIRFGVLTNGRLWRLYDNRARSKLEGFVEIDLFEAAGLLVPADGAAPDHADHVLRTFLFLFSAASCQPGVGGRTPLAQALEASRGFEARVTDALADAVFDRVFPDLADALARRDPQSSDGPDYFAELREAALTWLYRLLFTLYAEDRDLIPTRTRPDGLRAMRDAVAAARDGGTALSDRRTGYDDDLRAIWKQIDEGDAKIGLPPYNGGLFRAGRSALLDRSRLSDEDFAPLLDALSRERTGASPRLINYRDLNVQHLGSVYERLLEFDLVVEGGRVITRPQTFARKTSGSYYTPEELVLLVIRRTVGPLLEERRARFRNAVDDPERRRQDAEYRLPWLQKFDPASAFLDLRICDPAMGSGHFLVSLVDHLADEVLAATREAAELVDGYGSPLLARLESIRARILAQAAQHGWRVAEDQLVDRQLVRRMILKRVIHGVDKNPMAVELAKLSLWLHTFTVGAPLSFLDHHLRCGDSLFGEWVGPALDRLERGGLFRDATIREALRSVEVMGRIENLSDADLAEVHESQSAFEELKAIVAPANKLLSLLQGYRWIEDSGEEALRRARALERASVRTLDPEESFRLTREAWDLKRRGRALDLLLEGELGDPASVLDIAYGRVGDAAPPDLSPEPALAPLILAAEMAYVSAFLHWEIAFPNVWENWWSARPIGGFDAIIGNPPWDKMRFEEVQWFKPRVPEIAHAPTSSARSALIKRLEEQGDPLWSAYRYARDFSERAMKAARRSPTLSPLAGGDTNIYALFVAQAQRLLRPDGICGFLLPTEIATALATAKNFRDLTTQKRLQCILDFQNRLTGEARHYFPDVYYREKFCVYVFGGTNRTWDTIDCAFFLRGTSDADVVAQSSTMTPAEFSLFNPNSGTAPVFREVEDATLTRRLYGAYPILVDHRRVNQPKAWPATYASVFHMANSSRLFRSAEQLVQDGYYPTALGRWQKGEDEWLPLYEGKLVQAFNHRAASIRREERNLHRVAQPVPATSDQLADPDWTPLSQFFVEGSPELNRWALAFKDVTSVTNARTVIASIVPVRSAGHTLPLIELDDPGSRVLLAGMFNSFVYDYLARQKVQKNHLAWFILEQLPVISPAGYDRRFGDLTAREIVAREVLRLTYTAHDMAPFARDMGYAGEPFRWDNADRRQRRARLDALYFHLYGLSRDEADYVLSTFPIVRRQDEAAFGGRFLTRDLILAHMAALDAGDTDAVIAPR